METPNEKADPLVATLPITDDEQLRAPVDMEKEKEKEKTPPDFYAEITKREDVHTILEALADA